MLCGVTPYNPEYRGDAEIIGNYISPDIEKLMSLNPDIVLLSDEDSAQSFVVHGKSGLRYYRFGRVGNFDDICSNYMVLADMLGRTSAAANIKIYRERLSRVSRPEHEPGVIFLVSVKPLITVSGSSYISSIIRQAGGRNLFENGRTPYPILNMEALLLADPDAVIVMIHDDREYLEKYLERFKNVRFVKKKNIYSTGDGSIPYYSPERYVESVEIFAGIFAGLNE
jgi:ABC-type Fe3+-hydroxamate transport system substrate-binding protein